MGNTPDVILGDPTYIANLGHVYGVSGDTMRALQTLNTLKSLAGARSVPAYDLAVAYAGVNDRRAALRALKAAYDEGSPWLDNVAVEPRFHVLRSEPEFIQIIRALGLPILAPTATYSNGSATGGRRPGARSPARSVANNSTFACCGLDPAFCSAIVRAESDWRPEVRSISDARGLMQLVPATGANASRMRRARLSRRKRVSVSMRLVEFISSSERSGSKMRSSRRARTRSLAKPCR